MPFASATEEDELTTAAVELLDHRWKEQKARADARYATTNLAAVDVATNLKRLASQRADLFDTVGRPDPEEEEQAKRMKATVNNFDGNPHGNPVQQPRAVGEQIRAIRQKFSDSRT